MACVKNKILVLMLPQVVKESQDFKEKTEKKRNLIFGNLSQTEILWKEGYFRNLLIGQIGWGWGKEVGGLKTGANAQNKIM